MITAIRAELFKFHTIRLFWGLLAAAVGLNGLVATVTSSRAGLSGGSLIVPSLSTAGGLKMVMTATGFSLLIALVCGVIVAAGEYRSQTITDTYLDEPNRIRVLAAKVVSAMLIGFGIGLISGAVSAGIGLVFAASKGFTIALAAKTIVSYVLGNAVGAGLLAAIGVAIGSLVRAQIAAIIAVFVWAFGVEQIIASMSKSVAPYLPYTAAATLAGARGGEGMPQLPLGLQALPFGGAILVLVGIVALLSVVAAHTTIRRDVS